MSAPADQIPPSAAMLVGVARRDITPPVGIYARSWGAAKHDVAEGVHRPLSATVMVMRAAAGDPPLVLASIDAGWWQKKEDEWFVRGGVMQALQLQPAQLMLAFTHTHAGASICTDDADKPGGHLVEPYLKEIRDALIDAGREALEEAVPAVLTWGYGRCDLAANRDLPDPAGRRVVCGFNPSCAADQTVLIGRVTAVPTRPSPPLASGGNETQGGEILATVVNYACHPTTLAWDNRLISPDFVGAMREVVEGHTGGAACLFLQGASGELAPREQYTGDTAIADANGRRLGFAALAVLEGMLPARIGLRYTGVVESGAPLATWGRFAVEPSNAVRAEVIDVELPLKKLPTQHEIQTQLSTCTDRAMAERLRRKLRVVQAIGSGPTCKVPVWIWRVGQSLFVAQPNEAYSIFQIELRKRFPDYAVAVMNVVNGAGGYLSPPELYDQDIYQVWQSPYERASLPTLAQACERQIERMIR